VRSIFNKGPQYSLSFMRATGWGDARNHSGAFAILSEVGGGRKQPAAGARNPMARETEIKLKITNVPAFHRALKRIGALPAGPGTSKVMRKM